jgi:hypothetical protein
MLVGLTMLAQTQRLLKRCNQEETKAQKQSRQILLEQRPGKGQPRDSKQMQRLERVRRRSRLRTPRGYGQSDGRALLLLLVRGLVSVLVQLLLLPHEPEPEDEQTRTHKGRNGPAT